METVTIHVRHVTSEFDAGEGPGQLFDEDVRLGVFRAYRKAVKHFRPLSKSKRAPAWMEARGQLRSALPRITRNYWQDYDYDDQKNAAKVKAEARKLISPLSDLIKVLEERPAYVRRGLNSEAAGIAMGQTLKQKDIYTIALVANQVLLQASLGFVENEYKKGGEAIRFRNACRELVILWEELFKKRFPRNFKTATGTDKEVERGVKRVFQSLGAAFVYLMLHEIGNRWVTVSQVEEGLRALKKEK